MSPRLYLVIAALVGILLVGSDVLRHMFHWPAMSLDLHNDLLAGAAVLAATGLHRRGFEQGMELRGRLARVARPQPGTRTGSARRPTRMPVDR